MRRLVALAATLTVCLAAPATAGGPNHVVQVSPTSDGQQQDRSGVQVARTGADTVDSSNVAIATPHDCTGCEGRAVSFQAVIATGDPQVWTPRNAAVAWNSNCTGCRAFAYAYQYAVQTDGTEGLTDDGSAKISEIRAKVAELVDKPGPPATATDAEVVAFYDDLASQLDALAAQFHAAIVADLRSAEEHPHDGRAVVRVRDDGLSSG